MTCLPRPWRLCWAAAAAGSACGGRGGCGWAAAAAAAAAEGEGVAVVHPGVCCPGVGPDCQRQCSQWRGHRWNLACMHAHACKGGSINAHQWVAGGRGVRGGRTRSRETLTRNARARQFAGLILRGPTAGRCRSLPSSSGWECLSFEFTCTQLGAAWLLRFHK